MDPNSHEALLRRREAGTLTWRGPALMLFARAAFAVGAHAVVAAVLALRASPTPWHDAEPWLPVYGTLIDAGCLALLWWLISSDADHFAYVGSGQVGQASWDRKDSPSVGMTQSAAHSGIRSAALESHGTGVDCPKCPV